MRFDLTRLGSREFEHLTQSIAVAELGPGVGVFGSGADGGREATFDGPVPIVTNGHKWSGYGVIQAKYKEILDKPKEDATWLISEINGEMKGWTGRKEAGKRIPAYYIVSTNVRLSPMEEGGIDRVNGCLANHAKSLGFDGWVIWHSDVISTFIANHRDIRISYASWVTVGDVLSTVLENRENSTKEFTDALASFTAKELLRERYVNLDQAGSVNDRNVALADIFIDLPYGNWSEMEDPSPGASRNILASLISAADHGRESISSENRANGARLENQRFVLIGGPGQGKTTITQFACQMYRSALVSDSPAGTYGKVREACEKISNLMEQEGLDQPKNRRWPVNIQLTRLADEIAKGESTSLLDYLSKVIARKTTMPLNSHQLRDWLATYPWFMVLDGLDEVPAASNRAEVLDLIDDFLIEAAAVNADLFVVATTRPQGYTDEFSPNHYRHLQLSSLSRDVAMRFGKKLATARHGMESDRTDRLMERLERAYVEPATSRLMATPLQVTILAVLLERVGQAPKDRYNLFADYYRVIYERELEKDSQASALLRDRRSDVDAIHAHVGLLLQTRSEHSGETHSTLSSEELGQIVRTRLEQEGHKGASLASLCMQVTKTATDRLVFLVSTRSDEIGFEIRSLQEFWAAQGIMQGMEAEVSGSLRLIASSAHWRNTLLFAIGHIFSKRENMRDTVIALVSELNSHSFEHGEVKKVVLSGSRLAVAILSDGMVKSPIYLQSLADQAIQLFQLPPDSDVRTVSSCIPEEMVDAVIQLTEGRIQGRAVVDDLSLLYALSVLSRRRDLSPTVSSRLNSFINPLYSRISQQCKIDLLKLAYKTGNPTLIALTQDSLVEASLSDVIEALGDSSRRSRGRVRVTKAAADSSPEWARAFRVAVRSSMHRENDIHSVEESLGFDPHIWAIEATGRISTRLISHRPPKSTLVHDLAVFSGSPSAETLAAFLRVAASHPQDLRAMSGLLPWVATQALAEEASIEEAAAAIEAGEYGDLPTWKSLEASWAGPVKWPSFRNSMKDYVREGADFYPLSAAWGSYRIPGRGSASIDLVKSIFSTYGKLDEAPGKVRSTFASWLLTVLFVGAHVDELLVEKIGPSMLHPVVKDATGSDYINLGWIDRINDDSMHRWVDCLDLVGRAGGRINSTFSSDRMNALLSIWAKDPRRWGLARLAVSSREATAASMREPIHWHTWSARQSPTRIPLTEEAEIMILLVAAVFGEPESRLEARHLCDQISDRSDSARKDIIEEGVANISPGRSQLSRVFTLMCAEGVAGKAATRQLLIERVVEAIGQDPSGLGEVSGC